MTVDPARFNLEFDPEHTELDLVHIDCGKIVVSSLAVDNFTLKHWIDYARKHKCNENEVR
jgi:hypothetical protein